MFHLLRDGVGISLSPIAGKKALSEALKEGSFFFFVPAGVVIHRVTPTVLDLWYSIGSVNRFLMCYCVATLTFCCKVRETLQVGTGKQYKTMCPTEGLASLNQ